MSRSLESRRLRLDAFTLSDVDLLHTTFIDPFVRKFLWDDESITREQARDILVVNDETFREKAWGLWKIVGKDDHTFLGFVGLWNFFEEGQPQLLYGLLSEKTGLGYATEAAQRIIDYAFNSLKFQYVVASCDTPNVDSIKVCERLGMRHDRDELINEKMTSFFRIDFKM